MCELYLHSAPGPTAHHPWLAEFIAHADAPWTNRNGWGLAAFQGEDALDIREPICATDSGLATFLLAHPPETATLIGHIRAASSGGVSLANTQPLSRETGGSRIVFAHNGSVADFMDSPEGQDLATRAIGTADSEIAFLRFVDFMEGRALGDCVAGFKDFARCMSDIGPFNVIVSDGHDTLAHSDVRKHMIDGDDAGFRGPGLYLQRDPRSHIVLSSEPLTGDADGVPRGTSFHIRGAEIVSTIN